jgi:hypothetical protein
MARLLVVSRSMALAMRIADDHDVVEYPAERLEDLAPGEDVEAVVLDLGEPSSAMQALDRLRDRGFATPVLIVSGYQPAWKELVDLSIEHVVVVPLPITRAALLDGVDRLLGRSPATRRVPSEPPRKLPRRQPGSTAGASGAPAPAARASGPAARSGQVEPATAGSGEAAAEPGPATRPAAAQPAPAVGVLTPPDGVQRPVRTAPDSGGTDPGASARTDSRPDSSRDSSRDSRPNEGSDAGERPRRGGLSRLLSGGGQRPAVHPPEGSPRGTGSPRRNGFPLRPPSTPQAPPGAESDLFRPVVEPSAPVRSPSARPRNAVAPPADPPAERRPPAPGAHRTPPAPPAPPPAAPATAAPASPAPSWAEFGPPAPGAHRAPPTPGRGTGQVRLDRGRGGDGRRTDGHPGFTPVAGVRSPDGQLPDDIRVWVRALLDRRSELFGVAETAQVLADEVVERGESDAAAVLVPDGAQWRVSGGVGLRPVERRLLLDRSHWLISEIALGGRALLIEDTDIVRPRLAGAPLAAWRHLLAVPVPGIRAAVVLARGQEADRFSERDLAAVVPVVTEAGPLLTAALQMRELARVLGPLRDLDDDR